MARKTEITLASIGFVVRKERQQMTDEKGQPIFGASGMPKMIDLWVLDLIEQKPGGSIEIIHVPFEEAAKDRLMQAFTGGLVVASEMPNGAVAI